MKLPVCILQRKYGTGTVKVGAITSKNLPLG